MGDAKFLNQKAIDALFEARTADGSPEPAAPEVQAYDFLRPSRLAPRARLVLESAQGAFVLRLKKMLSFQLRTPVDAAVTDVENVAFSDLALSMGSPAAAFLFQVDRGEDGLGVLDWGLDGAMSIVDRLLGGTGGAGATARPLTAIEQGIVRRITALTLPLLRDGWKELLPLGAEILGFETDPARSRIAKPGDRYLATYIRIRAEGFENTITVGVPYAPLEPKLDAGAAGRAAPGPKAVPASAAGRALAGTDLRNSRLTVTARLPQITLRMGAVSRLAAGQIIDSGYPLDTPVDVHVNGRLLFRGALGQHRGQVGLRILDQSAAGDGRAQPKQGRML